MRPTSYSNPFPDVTGLNLIPDSAHPYLNPTKTDQRGPCPGLNALANHGYLPHNGIVHFDEIVSATMEGFNLGEDVAAVLSAIAVGLTGNPDTQLVSIGGADARVNTPRGARSSPPPDPAIDFGLPRGMNAHNSFETDGSLSRFDYFLNAGDDFSWVEPPYKTMSDVAIEAGDDYGLPTMHTAHHLRFIDSKTTNPYWFNAPPSAILTVAAAAFVPRCFANGTFGQGGVANALNVDTFFGAIPDDAARSNFTWIPERFPTNWFRTGISYNLKDVVSDVLSAYAAYPDMLVWGGNAGSTTSFVPLSVNAPTDVDGFGCFLYNAQLAYLPNQLADLSAGALAFTSSYLDTLIGPRFHASFGCGPFKPNSTMEQALSKLTTALGHPAFS